MSGGGCSTGCILGVSLGVPLGGIFGPLLLVLCCLCCCFPQYLQRRRALQATNTQTPVHTHAAIEGHTLDMPHVCIDATNNGAGSKGVSRVDCPPPPAYTN